MRLRNIRGSREVIAKNKYVILEEEVLPGHWHEKFGNRNPIHIEIGTGKGKFITTMAENNPSINYVGIEKFSSVLVRALEKIEHLESPPSNLYFIRMDAEYIQNIFAQAEVERIYLNFSDPWPKDRHSKRRLTSKNFLERYHCFLSPTGQLEFKTDNRSLFDFSVASIEQAGWKLKNITYDLHQDKTLIAGNVMTEYEERFSSKGIPICKLIATQN